MANKNQVSILNRGVAEWNEWRASSPSISPDLSGIRVENINLSKADFSKTNLIGTAFVRCNLEEANFSKITSGMNPEWSLTLYILAIVAISLVGIVQAKFSLLILGVFVIRRVSRFVQKEKIVVTFESRGGDFSKKLGGKLVDKIDILLIGFLSIPSVILSTHGFLATFPILVFNIIAVAAFAESQANTVAAISQTQADAVAVSAVIFPGLIILLSFLRMLQYNSVENRYPEVDEIFSDRSIKLDRSNVAVAYPKLNNISSITRYPTIDALAAFLGCIRGTRFIESNLEGANFSGSSLKFADFSSTRIRNCDFEGVKNFNLLRVDNGMFRSNKLLSLIVDRFNPGSFFNEIRTEIISQKSITLNDFSNLNLEGMCLKRANLERINLQNSNLSFSNLRNSIPQYRTKACKIVRKGVS